MLPSGEVRIPCPSKEERAGVERCFVILECLERVSTTPTMGKIYFPAFLFRDTSFLFTGGKICHGTDRKPRRWSVTGIKQESSYVHHSQHEPVVRNMEVGESQLIRFQEKEFGLRKAICMFGARHGGVRC